MSKGRKKLYEGVNCKCGAPAKIRSMCQSCYHKTWYEETTGRTIMPRRKYDGQKCACGNEMKLKGLCYVCYRQKKLQDRRDNPTEDNTCNCGKPVAVLSAKQCWACYVAERRAKKKQANNQ